jgi:c-di-GMP-binding flagellar brake protein YcgR
MTTSQACLDRRAFPRHQIRDSSTVMLTPDKIISFRVLDISKSGLSFCYNGNGVDSRSMGKAVLDFFGEKIGVLDLPVRIVFDTQLDHAGAWFMDEETEAEIPYLRRCGIEFGELSDSHRRAIDNYIQDLSEEVKSNVVHA